MPKETFPKPEEQSGAEESLTKVNTYFDFLSRPSFEQEIVLKDANNWDALKKDIKNNAPEITKQLFEKAQNGFGEERQKYIYGLRRLITIIGFEANQENYNQLGIDDKIIDQLFRKGAKESGR